MRISESKLRRFVEGLGGTIEFNPQPYEARVDAPAFQVWKGTGLHSLVSSVFGFYGTGGPAQVRADMWERVQGGLEECATPACDYCAEAALADS